MRLLFNPETKSIVMYLDGNYYDMRNGKLCSKPAKFSTLKSSNKEYRTKPFKATQQFINKISSLFDVKEIEYGYSIDLGEVTIFLIITDSAQLIGNIPLYFLKAFIKFIENYETKI